MVLYKNAIGFDGYRVGNDGSVWTCKNNRWGSSENWKQLKPYAGSHGHLYVTLYKGKRKGHAKYVHRLVLEAFVGVCPEGQEACHFPDYNPANCKLENLRWDTHKANMGDSVALERNVRGSRQHLSKLSENDVRNIRRMIGTTPIQAIANIYSVSRAAINHIRRKRTWAWLT